MLKEKKDNSEEHNELLEMLKTQVIWLTGRIEKATNTKDLMSIE